MSQLGVKTDWMVCVRSYTYNHAPYIVDTLNGFAMQQTTFPYVCCIVDDASTDGEQEVIRNYLDENFDLTGKEAYVKQEEYGTVIFAPHKKNLNCYFAVILLSENHYSSPELRARKRSYLLKWEENSRFIALCEGDDYWIDPLKLEKQVKFLNSHSDFAMSFSKSLLLYQETGLYKKLDIVHTITFEDLLYRGNTIPTASVLIRQEYLAKYNHSGIREKLGKVKMGDYQIWLWMAQNYKIHFLQEETTVYRMLKNSASHGSFSKWLEFLLSALCIREYFAVDNALSVDSLRKEKISIELVLAIENQDTNGIRRMRKAYKECYSTERNSLKKFRALLIGQYPSLAYQYYKYKYRQNSNPSKLYRIAQKINKYIHSRR